MSTLHNSVLSISIMMAGVLLASADGFKDTTGKYLDVMQEGKPLVRYMYEFDRSTPEKARETYKVYHHVMDS